MHSLAWEARFENLDGMCIIKIGKIKKCLESTELTVRKVIAFISLGC